MAREDHDQIQAMANGDIILNTVDHGVMFFNKSKLTEEYHKILNFTDFETVKNHKDEE